MNLTPGVTINAGDTVTRQTIYNLVANASGGTVGQSDLATGVLDISAQTDIPTPFPGKIWYDMADRIWKVYVDELDGTAVSVWTSFGPDRFDIPVLTTEPIPFGAALQWAGNGRRVKLPPGPVALAAMGWPDSDWEAWKVIGFNNDGIADSHNTADSGTWITMAIEGVVWTWHPVNYNTGGYTAGGWKGSAGERYDTLVSGTSLHTSPTSVTDSAGGLTQGTYVSQQAKASGVGVVLGMETIDAFTKNWKRSLFWGARRGRW
jgi:hypothetical protein